MRRFVSDIGICSLGFCIFERSAISAFSVSHAYASLLNYPLTAVFLACPIWFCEEHVTRQSVSGTVVIWHVCSTDSTRLLNAILLPGCFLKTLIDIMLFSLLFYVFTFQFSIIVFY